MSLQPDADDGSTTPLATRSSAEAMAAPTFSSQRFADGGHYRVEIPSVEGPEAMRAVIGEAERLEVVVHRISQGSGIAMLSDGEIVDMLGQAAAAGAELSLFLGPRATWDIGASAKSSSRGIGSRVRGAEQVAYSVDDALRAVSLGVRNLLVADEGVLWTLQCMRVSGKLPADVRFKFSALSGPGNPAAMQVLERLGADSINVPSDLTLVQLSQMRERSTVPIDFYVESPDNVGGFVRHHELPAVVTVAAPVYIKFGLRNAPDIYPSGQHISDVVLSSARERVRRAALGLSLLERHGMVELMSPPGSYQLGDHPRFTMDDGASAGAQHVTVNGAPPAAVVHR